MQVNTAIIKKQLRTVVFNILKVANTGKRFGRNNLTGCNFDKMLDQKK